MQLDCLLPPAPVPCIHALTEFFLLGLGILVAVFLDGAGAVAGHLGDVGNRCAGVQFAGDVLNLAKSYIVNCTS